MKVIELTDWGIEHIAIGTRPAPAAPGPGELLLEMRAASINFRDFVFARGGYGRESGALPLILLSDGAGIVLAAGPDTTRAAIGDLVCPIVMPAWQSGTMRDEHRKRSLGGTVDGVAAEHILIKETEVVKAPAGYSAIEAASLPCAAVTAWNALVMAGVKRGDLMVTQGTGGVSLFAMQFARAMGATVVITSSSDEKLRHAQSPNMSGGGAQLGINYDAKPEWAAELRRLTGNRGADLVIELGGAESLPQSIRAVRAGGTVALIGVLSGPVAELELGRVVTRGLRLQAVTLGSRESFEAMVAFIDQHQIKPVLDERQFGFDQTRAAIATISQGRHFGKLVVDFQA